MIIIPAIDIRDGKSVRLKQGKINSEVIHSTDPVFIAKLWKAKGAKCIHIVDLDGSFNGICINKKIVADICSSVDIFVEISGGIRNIEQIIEMFDFGVKYVVLGTVAVSNPDVVKKAINKYGEEKIIVSVDSINEKVAINGWKDITEINIFDFISRLEGYGIKKILYTDISRHGMLTGPNFLSLKKILKNNIDVIVSGGIGSINDLIKLKKYEKKGVVSVIIGNALYIDKIKFEDAIKIIED
jgi:phosphoribosylformimino-5-aminoimidazole carboxamide ribotide isomerase